MVQVIQTWTKKVLSNITIEPVLIFFLFGYGVIFAGLKNFELEKACATKSSNDLKVCGFFPELEGSDVCEKLFAENSTQPSPMAEGVNYTTEEIEHYRMVCAAKDEAVVNLAVLDSYRNIITGLIEVVILLFAGSWSDRVGLRKPCILIPIAADTISLLALIICAIFMREIPLEVTGILHQLISALGGGGHLIFTGVFSYLTIVTTESQRTFRFACASVVISVIPIIARFFSGHIFKALGFLKLCILCTTTHSIALLYGIFVLKEPDSDEKNKTVAIQDEPDSSSPANKLFDMTLATDCINVLTKKRAFNIRKILMFTFVVYFINFGAAGDTNVAFSIAQSKFHWVTNLGIWGAYDALTTQLGTMLAIGVLGKRFGVSDHLICAFSVCFTLIAKPIMAYAVSTLKDQFFYVATSIDIFDESKTVAIRSIVSKLVEQNEIGKINSLLGVIASAQSIVYPSIYSIVFLQSRDIFIGAVFMLAEAFLLVSLGLYIVLYIMSRKLNSRRSKNEKQGVDNTAMEVTSM